MTRAEIRKQYLEKHKALIQPRQGWSSLAAVLWLPYSMGIARGFTDLGTYVDKALDHGGTYDHRGPPAWAFDLGRKNRFRFLGWDYLVARRFAKLLWANHQALDIEYIILGKKIISRHHPEWNPYDDSTGSHSFHIHVSGHWPGRP
jgi:hypothetical protein